MIRTEIAGSRLFGEHCCWPKEPVQCDEFDKISGDPSANIGPQDDRSRWLNKCRSMRKSGVNKSGRGRPEPRRLKQTSLLPWRCDPEMVIRQLCRDPTTLRAVKKSDLDQEWFVDVFDCVRLFG